MSTQIVASEVLAFKRSAIQFIIIESAIVFGMQKIKRIKAG